jgi:hypothetical protein
VNTFYQYVLTAKGKDLVLTLTIQHRTIYTNQAQGLGYSEWSFLVDAFLQQDGIVGVGQFNSPAQGAHYPFLAYHNGMGKGGVQAKKGDYGEELFQLSFVKQGVPIHYGTGYLGSFLAGSGFVGEGCRITVHRAL